MRIEHVALWTGQLETLRAFYERHFHGRAGPLYVNESTGFRSYFLTFVSGARLELMQRPDMTPAPAGAAEGLTAPGWAHVAFAVGSRQAVDRVTARLQADGVRLVSPPRETGDGYYESVVLDPDGNRVEIAA